VLPWVAGLGGGRGQLAAAGIDGNVHVYDSGKRQLLSSWRAHPKAVNRIRPLDDDMLLTASNDATVRLWRLGADGAPRDGSEEPTLTFVGHRMSVSAMDVLGAEGDGPATTLFTGSRDCTVRTWDLATATELHQHKILRNVVTAVRAVPGQSSIVVQASEDLQVRLWDARAAPSPVRVVRAGPNQFICIDVTPDGNYVACGSKGFSRENCEVKVFDLRAGLKELCAVPCADQTIEALRIVAPDRCFIAGKDGYIRTLSLPDVKILHERGPAATAYTAFGVTTRPSGGLVALAALAGPNGPSLELLAWPDGNMDGEPALWAATADGTE